MTNPTQEQLAQFWHQAGEVKEEKREEDYYPGLYIGNVYIGLDFPVKGRQYHNPFDSISVRLDDLVDLLTAKCPGWCADHYEVPATGDLPYMMTVGAANASASDWVEHQGETFRSALIEALAPGVFE